jgi:short-subunit dehydrogenase
MLDLGTNGFSGTTALVTGGTHGIGLELARCFLRDGWNVLVVGDDRLRLREATTTLRSEFPHCRVNGMTLDLTDADAADELLEHARGLGAKVEALVVDAEAGAGAGAGGDFLTTDIEEELHMIRRNVNAVVHVTKVFARGMVARGRGRILITSSAAAPAGATDLTVYGATREFDRAFAMGLRDELRGTGVTVTALLPGDVDTQRPAAPADVAHAGYRALLHGDAQVA